MKILTKHQVEYVIQDPYVLEYKEPIEKALKGAYAVILMTAHDEYKKIKLEKLKKILKGTHPARNALHSMAGRPILIDGRNMWDKAAAQKLGFIYKGVGNI